MPPRIIYQGACTRERITGTQTYAVQLLCGHTVTVPESEKVRSVYRCPQCEARTQCLYCESWTDKGDFCSVECAAARAIYLKGFEDGRAACIRKLQEVSRYYATRPEAESIAGHIDELVTWLQAITIPEPEEVENE